jgi:hypothetical protein
MKRTMKQPARPSLAGTGTGGLLPAGLRMTALFLLAGCLAGCLDGKLSFTRNRAGTRSISLSDSWREEPRQEAVAASVDSGGYGEVPAGGYTGPNPEASLPKAPVPGARPAGAPSGDMVEIGEKFFIAQTNDVYLNPEDYLGKTIRFEGLFKQMRYEGGGGYCFVLRYGPGCCGNDGSAGFEVSWDRADPNPPPYPDEDDWVEAEGVLGYYREDDYPYLYLDLLSLKVKETRGAEFVSH